jgi:hypothetical protein
MENFEGVLSRAQMDNLKDCVHKCKYIDDARKLIHGNTAYRKCFDTCNSVILNIAQHCKTEEWVVCHAMMVVQTFISSSPPGEHIRKSSIPCFGLFWCYVSVASYAIAISFMGVDSLKVGDLMAVSGVPSCLYVKREYTRIQLQILSAIKWKLFFPTGDVILVWVG